ncbi:hypothetical protein CHS0354_021512 [Potamilus streckersoni]|uniref:Uncharacterized protein n=1 Tax=Potamilus streckersoni TaxID=2493646 RepID=A0AAE0SNN7_9BIVA|nr:hypothetical protein CHS0354_021512 [Potamilus streckersoni]
MVVSPFSFQIVEMEAWARKIFWMFALIVYLQARISSTAACSPLSCSQRKFEICCDDGEIFDVNITSTVGECGQSSCTGDTPQLIMQKLNCYWKNRCIIELPKDTIIQSTSNSNECIGGKPKVLVLHWWKCTQKGVNISYLKTNTTFNIGDKGILRSHSRFPWDYSIDDFNSEFKETYIVTVTFWLTTDYTVTITAYKVNVTDPDRLEWYTKQNNAPVPVSMGTVHFDQNVEKVYLQLNLSKDSKGDSGFLICFNYSSNGGTIQDACSDLTTTHFTAPKIPKSIKGEKKKKNKGKKVEKSKPTTGKGNQNKRQNTSRTTRKQQTG